jgi:hypothetical protein
MSTRLPLNTASAPHSGNANASISFLTAFPHSIPGRLMLRRPSITFVHYVRHSVSASRITCPHFRRLSQPKAPPPSPRKRSASSHKKGGQHQSPNRTRLPLALRCHAFSHPSAPFSFPTPINCKLCKLCKFANYHSQTQQNQITPSFIIHHSSFHHSITPLLHYSTNASPPNCITASPQHCLTITSQTSTTSSSSSPGTPWQLSHTPAHQSHD